MRLIQFQTQGGARRVGIVEDNSAFELRDVDTMHQLAMRAVVNGYALSIQAESLRTENAHDYSQLLTETRLLAPADHADPAHCMLSGTGLTHFGSASARDQMHHETALAAEITDSMRMFQWGVADGKPEQSKRGVQPEWFYKGDGSIVVPPGQVMTVPDFAEDGSEEPEVAGIYLIGPDCRPYRLGFALGNEFSDHAMEQRNYLYLAHSKLRCCSFGPELVTGPLPAHLEGVSRIQRDGRVVWEREFLSGESNMCHSIANLEYHHFKYRQFRNPGDLHIHFFGTATLSFSDQVRTRDGDLFEISIEHFGLPLRNGIRFSSERVDADTVQPL